MHEHGQLLSVTEQEASLLTMSTIAATRIDNAQEHVESLCARCCNGLVYRRSAPRNVVLEQTTYCHWMQRNVPNDVGSCSRFCDRQVMHLKDMQELVLQAGTIIDPRPLPGQHL